MPKVSPKNPSKRKKSKCKYFRRTKAKKLQSAATAVVAAATAAEYTFHKCQKLSKMLPISLTKPKKKTRRGRRIPKWIQKAKAKKILAAEEAQFIAENIYVMNCWIKLIEQKSREGKEIVELVKHFKKLVIDIIDHLVETGHNIVNSLIPNLKAAASTNSTIVKNRTLTDYSGLNFNEI